MSVAQFTATIQKSPHKGGWTYLIWPESTKVFGTKGAVKVRGTFDGEPFQSSFMAMGGGVHMLPITGAVLKKIGKTVGNEVVVVIEERL
ncbi:MAG: DUF1905 domain-containing protein [Candidatus Saccharimonadales bacterium]